MPCVVAHDDLPLLLQVLEYHGARWVARVVKGSFPLLPRRRSLISPVRHKFVLLDHVPKVGDEVDQPGLEKEGFFLHTVKSLIYAS